MLSPSNRQILLIAANVTTQLSLPHLFYFFPRFGVLLYDDRVATSARDQVRPPRGVCASRSLSFSLLTAYRPHAFVFVFAKNADLRRNDWGPPELLPVRDPSIRGPDSSGDDMPASRRVRQVLAHGGKVLLRLQLAGYFLPCSGDN